MDPVDPYPKSDPDPEHCKETCCGSMTFFMRIRIRGSIPLTNGSGSDPDPDIFVSDLQVVNKKLVFSKSFAYYFFKVQLHHFSKIKTHKEVTKQ
jgi:hypothetical protein